MPRASSKPPSTDVLSSTASALLDAAERLFAQDGFDNVTMLQIVRAAGHGNLSGAHYHFGNKAALIRTLLQRRMQTIDAMRHAYMDALVEKGHDKDLYRVIHSTIDVAADVVRLYPWGRDYLLLLAQVMSTPRLRLVEILDEEAIAGHLRTVQMVQALLPKMDKTCLNSRLQMFRREAANALAIWLQHHGPLTEKNQSAFAALVDDVAAFMTAGIAAPIPLRRAVRAGERRPVTAPTARESAKAAR